MKNYLNVLLFGENSIMFLLVSFLGFDLSSGALPPPIHQGSKKFIGKIMRNVRYLIIRFSF
jgi:hypothetical protein